MAPVPPSSGSHARDRLEKELQDEGQRIRDACLELTHIDPETERSRYEALVRVMLDALDRRVAHDSVALNSPPTEQQADLFDGIGVDPSALNALIAHLRSLSTREAPSPAPFQVLSHRVSSRLVQDPEDPQADASTTINWEDLANRMDALRQRLYQDTQADRSRPSPDGAAATQRASAPSSDGP